VYGCDHTAFTGKTQGKHQPIREKDTGINGFFGKNCEKQAVFANRQ
jgi:hypothetical protein